MKKTAAVLFGIALVLLFSTYGAAQTSCATIQGGELYASDETLITTGFDQYGYNYQAHMYNGRYCDYDRVPGGDFCDSDLIMKWNDAWLSDEDCDGDGKLDRHYGYTSYRGSGAWLTNHEKGSYQTATGKVCKYVYFVKIVAAPESVVNTGGIWYTAGGVEIGPAIWGAFAIIEEIWNDPCEGVHGKQYVSPDHAGFGGW